MKKIFGIMITCLFTFIIYLKQDAQVGIFENTPYIQVDKLSSKSATISIIYNERIVHIPYNSIAYIIRIENEKKNEKQLNMNTDIKKKDNKL